MDKYNVAQILREIGFIIELTDPYPKKGIAYRRAAHIVEEMEDFEKIVAAKKLESFKGIGKAISSIITALMKKGKDSYHQKLLKKIPSTLFELQIPGLSIAKLRILYEKFHITNLDELEQILKKEIKLKGFGPAFIKKLQWSLESTKKEGYALYYRPALHLAQYIMHMLEPLVETIEISGSLRRKCELIYQIDLIAISDKGRECLSLFCKHYLVNKIESQNSSSALVVLKNGLKAYLTLASKENYPYELFLSTGNETHVNEIKNLLKNDSLLKIKKESDLYSQLHLSFIPPELREGYGEIEAAKLHQLPKLIEENEIKGTFHIHTVYSDGRCTIEEMAHYAKNLGWEYIGISDHSKSSYIAHGMDENGLLSQIKEIQVFNKHSSSFHIFKGIECDILKNGELDFGPDILQQLDFVIVSIHRYFSMEEKEMTKRLIKAIENPYTTIVGHLTGRLLRFRKPYQLNVSKVIDACIANDKIIELNSYPSRLDMDWRYWIQAKEKGLKCSINPDAHSLYDFNNIQLGVQMARKGWLEKKDVINTKSISEMKKFLKR